MPADSRLIAGRHAVMEATKVSSHSLQEILIQDGASEPWIRELLALATKMKVKHQLVDKKKLDRLYDGSHQGVIAKAAPIPDVSADDLKSLLAKDEPQLWVAVDGVEDPQNLGSLIRTSWLLGAKGMILPTRRSAGLTPTVHKVASGGVEHLQFLFENQFEPALRVFKESGFWVYGLDSNSGQNYYKERFSTKKLIILGSEQSGMRKSTHKQCDQILLIPQVDPAASLNVAISFAIVASEAQRQTLWS